MPNLKPIDEPAARGATADAYHDITQTLRVSGVNLVFRVWASYEGAFVDLWRGMRAAAGSTRKSSSGCCHPSS